jgi:hypothetical protein
MNQSGFQKKSKKKTEEDTGDNTVLNTLLVDSASSGSLSSSSSTSSTSIESIGKKLSDEVLKLDHGLTSDQVLYTISKKKETLTKSFLNVVKETAVDCQYNRQANIASDASLSSLKCYDTIVSDGDYTFDIVDSESVGKDEVSKVITKRKPTTGAKGDTGVGLTASADREPVKVLNVSSSSKRKTTIRIPQPPTQPVSSKQSDTESQKGSESESESVDSSVEETDSQLQSQQGTQYKRIQLPLTIRGIGTIQFLILVPSDIGVGSKLTKADLLSLESGIRLFNFYTFYGLLPSQPLDLVGRHSVVGSLTIDGSTITPVISESFKRMFSEVQSVEACMSKLGKFPVLPHERKQYVSNVRECMGSPTSDGWTCVACKTINPPTAKECSTCGLPREVST